MSTQVLSVSRADDGRLHVAVEAHAVEDLLLACVDTVQTALGVELIRLHKNNTTVN